MKILHKFILESMVQKNNYLWEIDGLNDGFNPTMTLCVRYEFTQLWYPRPIGWWYPGPMLNRINRVFILIRCIFFESLFRKNPQVKRAWLRAIWDGWLTEKFSRVRMSEDKVRTKDWCWSVGIISDFRELLGVSIVGLRVDGVLQMVSEPTLTVSWACVG
jgi:hypothetical protein